MKNIAHLVYDFTKFHNYINERMIYYNKQISYIVMNQTTYNHLFHFPYNSLSEEEKELYDKNYIEYNLEGYLSYATYMGVPLVIWNRLKNGEIDFTL